jgi:hypothetical protein
MSERRDWIELRIGITDKEAIDFLTELADEDNDVLRSELERNPREVLLKWNIDLAQESAPDKVKLPPLETIRRHIEALRGADPFGTGGGGSMGPTIPHGYCVLYVVHGNGVPPCPPPADAS